MTSSRDVAPRLVTFAWFWAFWHWSTESHRIGASLRSPLQGIGGLWDEWYHHEATDGEREAIERAGRDEAGQHQFISWLVRRWGPEAQWRGVSPHPRFVLSQLAPLPPFDRWRAMDRHRKGYGTEGVLAVVLSEGSDGESADVRPVEAILVPVDATRPAPPVVAEGFHVDPLELRAVQEATHSVLAGRGLARVIVRWVLAGRRPYPRAVGLLLAAAWAAVALLLGRLLLAGDPGGKLAGMVWALTVGWAVLAATGIATSVLVGLAAWRTGRRLGQVASRGELHVRLADGLRLVGGSAGVAFALNAIGAVLHDASDESRGSWLWERLRRALRAGRGRWAATGVILPSGAITAVALQAKIRACLQHDRVEQLIAPRQREARAGFVTRLLRRDPTPSAPAPVRGAPLLGQLGYAASARRLRAHACSHLADALLVHGGLASRGQLSVNLLAMGVSAAVMAGMPDLRHVMFPPPAPMIIATAGSSPFDLAVTLDATSAAAFVVSLESRSWANRRTMLQRAGDVSRASLPLRRLTQRTTWELDDGTLWVERRRRFLWREFAPGERVGNYSLRYLNQLNR